MENTSNADVIKEVFDPQELVKIDRVSIYFLNPDNESTRYDIELSTCDTAEKILGWTVRMSGKTWMTAETLKHFILLACKHHNVSIPNT